MRRTNMLMAATLVAACGVGTDDGGALSGGYPGTGASVGESGDAGADTEGGTDSATTDPTDGADTQGDDSQTTSGGPPNTTTAGETGDGPACAIGSDQVVASPVDIIVSIDQSASMGQEIAGVVDNFNTHLTDILEQSNMDYRVIFVTGANGLPQGPDFYHFPAGTNSSDALTLLLWTYDGYNKQPNTCNMVDAPNLRWSSVLRYESQKVFIVVTDDDPSSFNCANAAALCTQNCGGCANQCAGYCPWYQCPTYADQPAAWGGDDFPTELYKLAPAGMFGEPDHPKWTFHSIIAVDQQYGPNDPLTPMNQICNNNGNTGETSGVEYQKLSKLTGGIRFPSCDTNYSPVFEEIAGTIVPLACTFELEETDLGPIDPDKTNVEWDPKNGQDKQTIYYDDTKGCYQGANGWQWADDEYNTIVLCGDACEMVKDNTMGELTVVVGCETSTTPG